jgi:hypothetical protein
MSGSAKAGTTAERHKCELRILGDRCSLDRGYSRPVIVSKSDLDKMTADVLDRNNPELWKLERTIESSYSDYLPEEQASLGSSGVGLKDGPCR